MPHAPPAALGPALALEETSSTDKVEARKRFASSATSVSASAESLAPLPPCSALYSAVASKWRFVDIARRVGVESGARLFYCPRARKHKEAKKSVSARLFYPQCTAHQCARCCLLSPRLWQRLK